MNRHYIIGIDEAGRGAWAGPIVAGGFMLEKELLSNLTTILPGIKDSKKLKKQEREGIYSTIEYLSHKHECQYTFAYRDADIIDSVGIREANRLCMEDIILSFMQFIGPKDTVEVWIDGCDNYRFAVENFDYSFAKKKTRGKTVQISNQKSIILKIEDKQLIGGSGVKHCLSDDDNLDNEERNENERAPLREALEVPLGYGFTPETFDTFGYKSIEIPIKKDGYSHESTNVPLGKENNYFGTFGNKSTNNTISYLINGDNLLPIISLGGIIAKVIRDRMMCEYSEDFPEYGFSEHVGYGTRKHQEALNNYNITYIHRKSYAPVKRLISIVS